MAAILFFVLGSTAIGAAIAAITRPHPLTGALWLMACLLAVAGLYALAGAPLVAALAALIAAGAIVVLIVFAVMLCERSAEGSGPRQIRFPKAIGAAAAAYLAILMAIAVARPPFAEAPASGDFFEAPRTLGALLLDRYAIPFELTGLLLLAATVAAIAVAKRGARPEGSRDEEVVL
jgi:NADH-quinone oxidoreductase subunit J